MKISIIGTGYVGLVTGACLAKWGHTVTCIDKDTKKIQMLNSGHTPFFEPDLDDLLQKLRDTPLLSFSNNLANSIKGANIIFIAVGTPSNNVDGSADLSYVFDAAKEIGSVLNDETCVVIKSTVPIGTSNAVENIISLYRDPNTFTVASNPEFLRQGSAISDFELPDRIVIGINNAKSENILKKLYAPLITQGVPLLVTDRASSETIKYAANSFLAVKIAFINEISDFCESVRASISDVAFGMGLDERIGTEFLEPGPGYGGSCFPKDTVALLRTAQEGGIALRILEETINANNARKRKMVQKILDVCGGSVSNKTISLLGLSFKPNTDDVRESPAIPIIEALKRLGANVKIYDPEAMHNGKKYFDTEVNFSKNVYDCANNSDAVVVITHWDEFKNIDLCKLKKVMKGNGLVDLRNIIDEKQASHNGFLVNNLDGRSKKTESVISH